MGIFNYARRIRVGGKWFLRWGRIKKTDGDGGRREGAGMQQLRVKIEIWEERDVVVTVANEGNDNVLVDGLVIPVDHLMEIVGTPHVRGTAFLYQRQVQNSDQDIFDNAAINNNQPSYATAINDPPPAFELVLQPDPYFQRERDRYLLNNMNRLELDNMLVLAQTFQGICNFSTEGLSAREIREHVIRDFYDPRR